MSPSALTIHAVATAAETLEDPAVPAYVIGGIALVILLSLLLALITFGGGREHS